METDTENENINMFQVDICGSYGFLYNLTLKSVMSIASLPTQILKTVGLTVHTASSNDLFFSN